MLNAIFFSFLLLTQGDALRGPLAAVAAVVSSGAIALEDSTTEQAAEDVEIMRRLLVHAIDETAPAGDEPGKVRFLTGGLAEGQPITGPLTSFYSFSNASVVTHSRGFHVPGTGAIFAIDARVPVVAVEPYTAKEDGEERADDDWERIRREVRTGKTETQAGAFKVQFRGTPTKWELDPDAIDDIERAVLQTLARHGGRIAALDEAEDITVALYLHQGTTVSETGVFGYAFNVGSDDEDDDETAWTTLAGRTAPAQRLILRVRVADLLRAGKDGRELRERAFVSRY